MHWKVPLANYTSLLHSSKMDENAGSLCLGRVKFMPPTLKKNRWEQWLSVPGVWAGPECPLHTQDAVTRLGWWGWLQCPLASLGWSPWQHQCLVEAGLASGAYVTHMHQPFHGLKDCLHPYSFNSWLLACPSPTLTSYDIHGQPWGPRKEFLPLHPLGHQGLEGFHLLHSDIAKVHCYGLLGCHS